MRGLFIGSGESVISITSTGSNSGISRGVIGDTPSHHIGSLLRGLLGALAVVREHPSVSLASTSLNLSFKLLFSLSRLVNVVNIVPNNAFIDALSVVSS